MLMQCSANKQGSLLKPHLRPFCVEFASFPCACMGFLLVPQIPSTVPALSKSAVGEDVRVVVYFPVC